MSTESKPWVRVGGLWEKQTRIGLILTGKFGTCELIVAKNAHKKPGSKSPDFTLYAAEQNLHPKGSRGADDGAMEAATDDMHERDAAAEGESPFQ